MTSILDHVSRCHSKEDGHRHADNLGAYRCAIGAKAAGDREVLLAEMVATPPTSESFQVEPGDQLWDIVNAVEATRRDALTRAEAIGRSDRAVISVLLVGYWRMLAHIARQAPSLIVAFDGKDRLIKALAEDARLAVMARFHEGTMTAQVGEGDFDTVLTELSLHENTPAADAVEILMPRYMIAEVARDVRARPGLVAVAIMTASAIVGLAVTAWTPALGWIAAAIGFSSVGAVTVAAAPVCHSSKLRRVRGLLGMGEHQGAEDLVKAVLMLRIPSSIAVGLGVLLTLDPYWLIWATPGQALAVSAGLLTVALGYLMVEVNNHEVNGVKNLTRALIVGVLSYAYAIVSSLLALRFLWGFFHPGEQNQGWNSTGKTGLVSLVYPVSSVLACASAALATGLLIQAIWDDSPVSAPLATSRRVRPRRESE